MHVMLPCSTKALHRGLHCKIGMQQIKDTPSEVFVVENISFVLSYPSPDNVASKIVGHYKCNACTNRVEKYLGHCGPCGPLLLSTVSDEICNEETEFLALKKKALEVTTEKYVMPTLIVVTADTYPSIEEGVHADGVAWTHFTIVPHHVTPKDAAEKFEALWKELHSSMDDRLEKLIDPRAKYALMTIVESAKASNHPDHWGSTLEWIDGLRVFAQGQAFYNMSTVEKMRLRVKALASGHSTSANHADFSKSENIVDFIAKGLSGTAITTMMNGRRDERTYQQPQVAATATVSSKAKTDADGAVTLDGQRRMNAWLSTVVVVVVVVSASARPPAHRAPGEASSRRLPSSDVVATIWGVDRSEMTAYSSSLVALLPASTQPDAAAAGAVASKTMIHCTRRASRPQLLGSNNAMS